MGFRIGRQASSTELPLARGPLAARNFHAARRHVAGNGRAEDVAKKIRIELEMRGLHKEPVGIDIIELPVLFALQREGIKLSMGSNSCPTPA